MASGKKCLIFPKSGESMFLGSFTYSIDSKGRISIPAKLRKYVKPEANDTFVMTRGASQCIEIYPMDKWKELVEGKLTKLNTFDPENAKFLRMFLQLASEDQLDSQARLLIPQNLIDYAEIKKDVFVLGAMNRIELWNPEIYQKYLDEQEESFGDIAQKVMKLE